MDFFERVYELVRSIPRGRVATYGQIAGIISTPRAARVVGFALRRLPEQSDVPWQRVVGAQGRITIQNMEHPSEEQANLLIAEGVEVTRKEEAYYVSLKNYEWRDN